MEALAKIGTEIDADDIDADDAWAERRWREDVRLRVLARRLPEPLRLPSLAWIGMLAIVLALTLLRTALHAPGRAAADRSSIRIVLLDAPAPEPPLPQPAPLPAHFAARAPRRAVAPSALMPPAAPSLAAPAESEPLRLFNPDGSVVLPREPPVRSDGMAATFTGPVLPESMSIMRHQRPLKVRPNHFAQNFRQPSGSALTDFVADHLTAKREFTLPWGTHVECVGVSLFVAFVGGCGWYTPYRYYVPPPRWKPATELDEQ